MITTDLSQLLQETEVAWYGNEKKSVSILTGINLSYSVSEKPLLIRWVLVNKPGTDQAEAFLNTDLRAAPDQIINHFVLQ